MADQLRPIAFRIRDFRSIRDSGICHLSADRITVLAGQNESGKSAILYALRDFDGPEGQPPLTPEYLPEGVVAPRPEVSILFAFDPVDLLSALKEREIYIPKAAEVVIGQTESLWVTRDLQTGKYKLDESLTAMWHAAIEAEPEQIPGIKASILDAAAFVSYLHSLWPAIIHFDAFSDLLPRSMPITDSTPPQAVQDFLQLSDTSIETVKKFAGEPHPKLLDNYLSSRSADISGDFRTYWKQGAEPSLMVNLRVNAYRDASGKLMLGFYVRDDSDQFPDQRSKGFQWFLSFYLRMTAVAKKREKTQGYFLLVDEPGSYLHARAQRDILELFETRIALEDPVLYTTHSPYLLPAEKLHRVRLVVRTSPSGTRIYDRLTHPDLRGQQLKDTLSPILTSVGLDVSNALQFVRPLNVLVEGITDYFYLSRWATAYGPELMETVNIFPVMGGATMPHFASLFTGWGLPFASLLDSDREGKQVRKKLENDLAVDPARIVHPQDTFVTIEDHLSTVDFRNVLNHIDPDLTIDDGELPSAAIRRQPSLDKVLFARKFCELHSQGLELDDTSVSAIRNLLLNIRNALRGTGDGSVANG